VVIGSNSWFERFSTFRDCKGMDVMVMAFRMVWCKLADDMAITKTAFQNLLLPSQPGSRNLTLYASQLSMSASMMKEMAV
jgi:hypothetical protein